MSILDPLFRYGNAIAFEQEALHLTSPDDTAMLERLAVKCQIIAAEFGVDLDWSEAMTRARENLAEVRGMAGGVR